MGGECLGRLATTTDKIREHVAGLKAKIQGVADRYGSVAAFREYIEGLQVKRMANAAEDAKLAEARRRQDLKRKHRENATNTLQEKLRFERWMANYEATVKEIIQEEVDLLEEMEHEEQLAAMALIQDEVADHERDYNAEVEEVQKLLAEAGTEAQSIRQKLEEGKSKRKESPSPDSRDADTEGGAEEFGGYQKKKKRAR